MDERGTKEGIRVLPMKDGMKEGMRVIRAMTPAQRVGAQYVRIQGMAVKHHISLEEEFDEHDFTDANYIVILDDVLPIATGRMYPVSDEVMQLGRIVVLPEYRHQGLGSRVVREAEAWAKELGYKKTVLESRENKVEFYEKLGSCADPNRDVVFRDVFYCVYMERML